MKWGILATGTIAKKFASTVEQMGAEGEQLVAVGSRHLESAQAFAQHLFAVHIDQLILQGRRTAVNNQNLHLCCLLKIFVPSVA